MNQEFIPLKQAAEAWRVCERTMRTWVENKQVRAFKQEKLA